MYLRPGTDDCVTFSSSYVGTLQLQGLGLGITCVRGSRGVPGGSLPNVEGARDGGEVGLVPRGLQEGSFLETSCSFFVFWKARSDMCFEELSHT